LEWMGWSACVQSLKLRWRRTTASAMVIAADDSCWKSKSFCKSRRSCEDAHDKRFTTNEFMSIRSHTRMKLHVGNSDASSSFPHVFSGNPGGIRTGPAMKAFGSDGFEAVFTSVRMQRHFN